MLKEKAREAVKMLFVEFRNYENSKRIKVSMQIIQT